jgi:hypothetical protein
MADKIAAGRIGLERVTLAKLSFYAQDLGEVRVWRAGGAIS